MAIGGRRTVAPGVARPALGLGERMERNDTHCVPEPQREDRSSRPTIRQRSRGGGGEGVKKGRSDAHGPATRGARFPRTAGAMASAAGGVPPPFESIFSGARPQVLSRGFDPVFMLVDHGLMERLHETARRMGVESDYLLRQILREHIDEY